MILSLLRFCQVLQQIVVPESELAQVAARESPQLARRSVGSAKAEDAASLSTPYQNEYSRNNCCATSVYMYLLVQNSQLCNAICCKIASREASRQHHR